MLLHLIHTEARWHIFSGNEIGVLLAHWLIQKAKAVLSGPAVSKCAVLTTVVSSRMLKAIAAVEGVQYYETLTGVVCHIFVVVCHIFVVVWCGEDDKVTICMLNF